MHNVRASDIDIPALGFGTWQIRGQICIDMVAAALGLGYRHIDTAAIYENEVEVGRGLRAAIVDRGKVFVTTKVWLEELAPDRLEKAAEDSLKRLKLDYVDLLLIHWPNPNVPLADSIEALNHVRERGLTRAIGVANFPSALFEQAQTLSSAPLVTNQVEYHPYLRQTSVLAAARRHGSTVTAYSPLARGKIAGDPVLGAIAADHGVDIGQVALRWLVQQPGVIAIPKTATPARARSNLDIFEFVLTEDEMTRITALARPDGRLISPDFAPEWDRD
jgi:diketogulonate reductase-like aldo/keto reductase